MWARAPSAKRSIWCLALTELIASHQLKSSTSTMLIILYRPRTKANSQRRFPSALKSFSPTLTRKLRIDAARTSNFGKQARNEHLLAVKRKRLIHPRLLPACVLKLSDDTTHWKTSSRHKHSSPIVHMPNQEN